MPLKLAKDAQEKFEQAQQNPDFCGYLEKQGFDNGSWQKRWFLLKDNFLFYCKSKNSLPQGIIYLMTAVVVKLQGPNVVPNSFSLLSPKSASEGCKYRNRTYYFAASDSTQCENWIRKLQETSKRSSVNIQTNPVPIVMNMPIAQPMSASAPPLRFSSISGSEDNMSFDGENNNMDLRIQMEALLREKVELENRLQSAQEESAIAVLHAASALQLSLEQTRRENNSLKEENAELKEANRRALNEQGKMQETLYKQADEIKKTKEELEKMNVENRKLKETKLPDESDLQRFTAEQLEAAEDNFYQLLKLIRERKRELRTCFICMDKPNDTIFNCGHLTCHTCAANLNKCPTCRTDITYKSRMFS